ncbi:MAG: hypothetical protein HZB56_08895 [Deltaproteobacteria bacterium]|nr:hypothetical protein [Deltaproteobacteria bacterium]
MSSVWHIRVNGMPACACWLLPESERLDPPFCRSRDRHRLEAHAAMLRERHPELEVELATGGCDPSGE